MAEISKKKPVFKINDDLREYLRKYDREVVLPIKYADLQRYDNSISLLDRDDEDTFWETVFYPQNEIEEINLNLKKIYAILRADGDLSVMKHLYIERIDLCVYGNTQPFRVRVVNKINDNFDYFYIKNADASRIYGLELEHLLSPNRMSYFVDGETIIEEHIVGIPGDMFIKNYLNNKQHLNEIRLAKEFVKFNERCFLRLLGDMHSSNFVIDITPDFDDVSYRIRAIDFDQQSYDGRISIYMPKYYKQNNPLIDIGVNNMTVETMEQYQKEERSLIAVRLKSSYEQITELLIAMKQDSISSSANIENLKKDLADHYQDEKFLTCKNMGELVKASLETVIQ
ncbi:MAG: hypothetical protein OEX22_12690 [Cyclobacteriaceae bacterium]|nr:hypothetical protein [Cyclobacteriaceae bacterium]